VGLFEGCVTAQKVDSTTAGRYAGFVHDGETTKEEIENRLGPAGSSYENGRILIYHVYPQDDGRVNLTGPGTCHAFVVVFFNGTNVLERHSFVIHGCA
jgi:hypothetical protein